MARRHVLAAGAGVHLRCPKDARRGPDTAGIGHSPFQRVKPHSLRSCSSRNLDHGAGRRSKPGLADIPTP